MVCTFFGHRKVYEKIEPILRSTLIDLIENHEVKKFYVGNHGSFDSMVCRVLADLSTRYPITYYIVLAYMPKQRDCLDLTDHTRTIFPEKIETVPRRFAIIYRNKWMIRQADYVVTYTTNHIGSGAAQFKALAEKQGKTIIEIGKET